MRLAVLLTIGAALLLPAGCAPQLTEPYLSWENRPAAVPAQGHVAIKAVVNMRAAKHGDRDLNVIGNLRGASTVPDILRIDAPSMDFKFEPQGLDVALTAFVKDALRATGIGTTNAGDASATARLVVEVHEFWVDPPSSVEDQYVAHVSLVLVVQDPVTGQVHATLPVRGQGDANPERLAGHEMVFAKRACREALDQAYANLVAGLAEPTLLFVLAAPLPVAPTASAASAPQAAGPCASGQLITERTDGHCCWPGQMWANDRCNGRPTKCPSGQARRGDTCVNGP